MVIAFIVNYVVTVYLLEKAYKKNKRILDGSKETEEADKKFKAFRRKSSELKWFSRFW